MATIYELLRCKKGPEYREDQIAEHSNLHHSKMYKINKAPNQLQGFSRIVGDASPEVQDRIIDKIIELGVRYKLSCRDIAYTLLMCKVEAGFNPDAAAGTTSASGLGQYTSATIKEAREKRSESRLGFQLDMRGKGVFDAEKGAYGLILSYMYSKERSIMECNKVGGKDVERYIYIHHHEGWYFKHTAENMKSARVKEVERIRNTEIMPLLGPLEKLLSEKTDFVFKLLTRDDKPYPNQPYVAIHLPPAPNKKKPQVIQHGSKKKPTVVLGRTDGAGKTQPIETNSMSEVIFVILNKNYKSFLDVNKNKDVKDVHVVKQNETLAQIAKEEGVSVADLKRLNDIKDINKIQKGQKLRLHTGTFLKRRPPDNLVVDYLKQVLNVNAAAVPAIIEHARSHITLPKGNITQVHGPDKNVVVIKGGSTSEKLVEKKKTEAIPTVTKTADIQKVVPLPPPPPPVIGTTLQDQLLFPLPVPATQPFHTEGRRFGASRANNRQHAGCDLYGPFGTPVRAMAAGKVLECRYFWKGTWQVVIDHGNFLVRYTEVAPMTAAQQNALLGKTVARGEIIAKIGYLYLNGPNAPAYQHTMLHLEIYSTDQPSTSHSLTTPGQNGPKQRRPDIIDPAPILHNCVFQ